MPLFRTETCALAGHPEFTLTVEGEPPSTAAMPWLLGMLQDTVADGATLTAGSLLRVGWRILRVVDRPDATLGLQERVADDVWAEHVDHAMNDAFWQSGAAHRLGQPEDLHAVSEDDVAAVQPCAFTAHSMTLHRVEADRGYTWVVGCGDDEHAHDAWSSASLLQLSVDQPALTQFLALPTGIGILIDPATVNPVGGVGAFVAHEGRALTPPGGTHFGPGTPLVDHPTLRVRTALIHMGDGLYRTTGCAQHGHPEFVARVADSPLFGTAGGVVQWLLDHLADNVDAGTRYAAGQTILVGWRLLRVIERPDGMLGLQERDHAGSWSEHVEHTLRELWFQREVATSLAVEHRLSFPYEDDPASIAACAQSDCATVLLKREMHSTTPSGWSVTCGRDHSHGPWSTQSLRSVVSAFPAAMQFLALPFSTTVLVRSPDTTASGRIRADVTIDDTAVQPVAGSYLAMVNAD